jgi:hypothetical protein
MGLFGKFAVVLGCAAEDADKHKTTKAQSARQLSGIGVLLNAN